MSNARVLTFLGFMHGEAIRLWQDARGCCCVLRRCRGFVRMCKVRCAIHNDGSCANASRARTRRRCSFGVEALHSERKGDAP